MQFEDFVLVRDFIVTTFYSWGFGPIVVFCVQYWNVIIVGLLSLYIITIIFAFLQGKQKKIVYFVRHGETVLNAQHIRQGSAGKLSELGIKQAEILAERIKNTKIDLIFSSPFERTHETAQIIAQKNHKKIILNDLLAERRNPSEIIGKSYDDPEVVKVISLIDQGFHENGLRFSDEENFTDLKRRAEKLLTFIEGRREEHLLMVTHGIFLKMIISYMLKRENLTAADYVKYSYYNNATNAGLTICEYDPRYKHLPTKGWKLLVWDDYAGKDQFHLLRS